MAFGQCVGSVDKGRVTVRNETDCVLGGQGGWVSRSKYVVQEEINDEEDQGETDPV